MRKRLESCEEKEENGENTTVIFINCMLPTLHLAKKQAINKKMDLERRKDMEISSNRKTSVKN